jgi:pimeloyl-ACP methyl ester carboxylesterase
VTESTPTAPDTIVLIHGFWVTPRSWEKWVERYYVPASGDLVWAGPAANFTPGHQDTYVDFKNEDRAPLLFIAGGDDNLMPPAVNQSNVKHYRHSKSVTDYKEFPARSHFIMGQDGWEEVADYALEWAVEHAKRPAA